MKGELDGKWQRKKDQQISFSKGRGKPYKTFNTHLVSISFTHYKSNVIFCVFHTVSFIRNPFVLISYFVIQTITFLIFCFFGYTGFPSDSCGKESACNAGDLGLFPGWEDPLEKEMATHSSILAQSIPWTEEPGRLQSIGSQRIGHDLMTNTCNNNVQGLPDLSILTKESNLCPQQWKGEVQTTGPWRNSSLLFKNLNNILGFWT